MDILERVFASHSQKIFSISRLIVGFLFFCHGAQKIFTMFGGQGTYGKSLLLVAGIVEFSCGALFAVGLLTRYVAFIAAVEMLYAYLSVHSPQGGLPIQNGGELAVLYFCFFLFSIAYGAGTWSLDAFFKKRIKA
jgi:putative oxidoreductase